MRMRRGGGGRFMLACCRCSSPLIPGPDRFVQRPPLRLALLTLEALAATVAVRRFVARWRGDIALLALSDPFRPQKGGVLGQVRHLLSHSGPRLLPYLAANFVLPRLAGAVLPARGTEVDATPLRRLVPRL